LFEGIDGRLQLIRRGLYRLEVRVALAALRHRGDGLCESGRRRLDRGELGRQLRLDVSASGGGRRRHALDRGLEVTGSRTDLSSPGGLLDRRRSSRACGRGRRRRGSCCARSPRARGQQNCQANRASDFFIGAFLVSRQSVSSRHCVEAMPGHHRPGWQTPVRGVPPAIEPRSRLGRNLPDTR